MDLRMLTRAAGDWAAAPDEIVTVSEELGKELLAGGYAKEVEVESETDDRTDSNSSKPSGRKASPKAKQRTAGQRSGAADKGGD